MNYNLKYKLTNNTEITGDDIAVKDMLVQQRPIIKEVKKLYCRYCGSKVLESGNFCSNCGHSVNDIIDQQQGTELTSERKHSTHRFEELPTNWWKFCEYVRFPIGFISLVWNIIDYLQYSDVSFINILVFLIDFAIAVFMVVTYYHFLMRNKIGYKFLNSWLLIELVINAIATTTNSLSENYEIFTLMDFVVYFVITVCILGIVWTLPNYIYFKNRKYLFDDSIKNSEIGV